MKKRIEKDKLKLSEVQREILIGKLLGDGHLETNNGITYRLKIEHSIKQQDYVQWLYQNFKDWVLTPPKIKTKFLNDKTYQNIWFNTVFHIAFRYYGKQFYQDKQKVVPKYISRILKSRAMAVWFMDDGSIKSQHHRALILNTQGFLIKDQKLLQNALLSKWQIESSLRKQKEGWQILITGESAIKFAQIIIPYLLPSFDYKLGKIGLTLLPKM